MSDSSQTPSPDNTAANSTQAPATNGKGAFHTLVRGILFLALVVTIGYVGFAAVKTMNTRNETAKYDDKSTAASGLITPSPKHLASQFADSQGRLLADAPASPDKLIDPPSISIAHLVNADETPGTSWLEFEKYLSTAIGKPVTDIAYDGTTQQFTDMTTGKITLLAIHPADAPFLVNNYGFEPLAVLGTGQGANGNHLDIIVPKDSLISNLGDLKGHSLACSAPSSITGYRAAVAELMQDAQLRPNVDYFICWTMGQKNSITGLIKKEYDAAAVSDDKLQKMNEDGRADKTAYKTIYQSQVIPRTTIGYFYNLKPELATKIHDAILAYVPPAAAGVDGLKFLPTDYKTDFQFVRLIDDSFDPRMDGRMASRTHQE